MRAPAAAALLAQGRRRDAGDRAGDRGGGRPAARAHPGRASSSRSPCSPSRSGATSLWLWSHRHASHGRRGRRRTSAAGAAPLAARAAGACAATASPPRSRSSPSWSSGSPSSLPTSSSRLTPGAFAAAPARGPRRVALALVLPTRDARLLACVVGPVLGLLVIVKILDMGFFETFDRPFDPVADGSYTGIGIETLRDSIGRTRGEPARRRRGGARRRPARADDPGGAAPDPGRGRPPPLVAAGRRRRSASSGCSAGLFGAQLVSDAPIASTSAAGLVVHEVRAVQAGVDDHAVFADEIRHDRYRSTPGSQLLTGLRGKDVLLVFVESYGKVAVQDSVVLATGRRGARPGGPSACRPPASPPAAASSPRRRSAAQLAGALHPAVGPLGRQPAALRPARQDQPPHAQRRRSSGPGGGRSATCRRTTATWPEGTSFYHYDKLYDRRNVGYRGPKFSYASMPDQYVFLALQRLELAKPDRRPLFAEVDLVSSHTPWTRIPTLIDWNDVGDGSIFKQHAGRPADAGRALRRPRAGARGLRPVRSSTR